MLAITRVHGDPTAFGHSFLAQPHSRFRSFTRSESSLGASKRGRWAEYRGPDALTPEPGAHVPRFVLISRARSTYDCARAGYRCTIHMKACRCPDVPGPMHASHSRSFGQRACGRSHLSLMYDCSDGAHAGCHARRDVRQDMLAAQRLEHSDPGADDKDMRAAEPVRPRRPGQQRAGDRARTRRARAV